MAPISSRLFPCLLQRAQQTAMGFLMAPLEQNRDNKYALDLSTLQGQKDVVYFPKIFVFHV